MCVKKLKCNKKKITFTFLLHTFSPFCFLFSAFQGKKEKKYWHRKPIAENVSSSAFTFTIILTIIFQFLYQHVTVLVQKLNYNCQNNCKSKVLRGYVFHNLFWGDTSCSCLTSAHLNEVSSALLIFFLYQHPTYTNIQHIPT